MDFPQHTCQSLTAHQCVAARRLKITGLMSQLCSLLDKNLCSLKSILCKFPATFYYNILYIKLKLFEVTYILLVVGQLL